jgi:hypothetical protein
MSEFNEFRKIPRLSREVIITEKIDGTNAQVCIEALDGHASEDPACVYQKDGLAMWTGSRNRWITPAQDNFGFSKWAVDHADELLLLGPGRHYGEWWGSGIQRGYGLPKGERRFSLFNVQRWCLHGETPAAIPNANPTIQKLQDVLPACVGLVPVLGRFEFDTNGIKLTMRQLGIVGSQAAPGFMNPEGIVIYHVAGNLYFKKTFEKDESPKGAPCLS